MKYSFLIPAYKSNYFEETLRSITNQTFPDFEVVVSDDCSPEDIKSIVDKFNDQRIIYRRNQSNIGAAKLPDHWNLLLRMCNADYCIMASDDDVYDKDYLFEIDKLAKKYPDVDVLKPRRNYIDSYGHVLQEEPLLHTDRITRNEYISLFAKGVILSGISHYVFKRTSLIKAGGFVSFPYAWYSDDATVLKMAAKDIGVSDSLLFSMRKSQISISSGHQSSEMVKGKILASKMFRTFISSFDLPENELPLLMDRSRRVTNLDLKHLGIFDFFTTIKYAGRKCPELYPLRWRVKKCMGYLYHNVLNIK